MVNSLSDPFIFGLIKKFGGNGYLVYFGVLEILGEQEAISKPFKTTGAYLEHKLQLKNSDLKDVLNYCNDMGKLQFKTLNEDDDISIFCPKFMEFSDNWTVRKEQLPSNYRVTTEQLPIEEKRRDKIRSRRDKKRIEKTLTSPDGDTCAAEISFWNDFVKEHNKTAIVKLAEIQKNTTLRLKHLQTRKAEGFDINLVFAEIKQSKFLRGESKDWKVDFDFVISPSGYAKIIEGKYRDKKIFDKPEDITWLKDRTSELEANGVDMGTVRLLSAAKVRECYNTADMSLGKDKGWIDFKYKLRREASNGVR